MIARLVRDTVGAAALALAALVLFSLLAPWIGAADSVGHFRHYLAAALGALALAALGLRLWRAGAVAGGAVVAALLSMPQLLPAVEDGAEADLVLVQANVHGRNVEVPGLTDLARGADLLTLQEVSPLNEGLLDRLAAEFPSVRRCRLTDFMNVAVLSRRPALGGGCAEGLAWLRIEVDGRELTVASLHLHWPWPFGQQGQIERLRRALEALPRPVLLAGDFNAAPWSGAVAGIAGLTATEVVPGLRTTIVQRMPFLGVRLGLPIDHVLVPAGLGVAAIGTGASIGSDHLPVSARLFWR